MNNVTAGIRGTDLWGKSTDQRDLVCLLVALGGAFGHVDGFDTAMQRRLPAGWPSAAPITSISA